MSKYFFLLISIKLHEDYMKLSAPKKIVFLISLILAIIAVVAHFVAIPFVSIYGWWILLAGYIILALGVFLKGF